MTAKELNRDIKRLNSELYRMSFEDQDKYFEYVNGEAKSEFLRLYHADNKMEYMNKQSVLTMFRLNLKHRFVTFHTFGINIELF